MFFLLCRISSCGAGSLPNMNKSRRKTSHRKRMEQNELKKLIEEILTHLAVSVESVALTGEGIHPIFLIKTADSGVLIGTNGETLRALNHIIKKIVEKRTGEAAQFLLDVNEYYGRRIQEIKNQAALLGERARVFKADVEMNPMNSYERMIIHA